MEVVSVAEELGKDDEVDWLECISAIETDQGLIYFCDAEYSKTTKAEAAHFRASFPCGTSLYSITAYNPFNTVTNRVTNELANLELLKDVRELLPGCNIYNNFSFFPSRPYHFERGFTIQVPQDYEVKNHAMIIYSLAIKYDQAAFFKGVVLDNGLTIPYVVLVQGEYTEIKENLVSIEPAPIHPAFLHQANHAIFHNLNDILCMLNQTKDHVNLSKKLYETFMEHFQPITNTKTRYPIIAVEGSSYTGAMAAKLSQMLSAEFRGNTPACMEELKEVCQQTTILSAAFKTIADYIQASQIAQRAETKAIIVNKYWFNTAASLIASEINSGQRNLPPKDHSVYKWPEGLLKPDSVIFLQQKPNKKTIPNKQREKLKLSAFQRMKDDSWISVSCTNRHVDVLLPQIIDRLHKQGVTNVSSVHGLCPGSAVPPPTVTYSEKVEDSASPLPCGERNGIANKPFWW